MAPAVHWHWQARLSLTGRLNLFNFYLKFKWTFKFTTASGNAH